MKFDELKKIGSLMKNAGKMKALQEQYGQLQQEYQFKKFYGSGGSGDLTVRVEFSLAEGFTGFQFSDNMAHQPAAVLNSIVREATNAAYMNAQLALKQAMESLQEQVA